MTNSVYKTLMDKIAVTFDPNEQAIAVTNELFYSDGPEARAIEPRMAMSVKAAIAEALWDAHNKGWSSGYDAGKDTLAI